MQQVQSPLNAFTTASTPLGAANLFSSAQQATVNHLFSVTNNDQVWRVINRNVKGAWVESDKGQIGFFKTRDQSRYTDAFKEVFISSLAHEIGLPTAPSLAVEVDEKIGLVSWAIERHASILDMGQWARESVEGTYQGRPSQLNRFLLAQTVFDAWAGVTDRHGRNVITFTTADGQVGGYGFDYELAVVPKSGLAMPYMFFQKMRPDFSAVQDVAVTTIEALRAIPTDRFDALADRAHSVLSPLGRNPEPARVRMMVETLEKSRKNLPRLIPPFLQQHAKLSPNL